MPEASERKPSPRTIAGWVLDGVTLVVGMWLALQIFLAFQGRWAYPYDLEWMEGGMLAHAWRVSEWMPLYVEPDRDWIPYIYPPGYPALLAGLSSIFGLSAGVGRLISVCSTLAACGALVFGGWRHGESVWTGMFAAIGFLLLFPDSGAFYDLVRPDSLAVALLGWALVLGIDEHPRLRVLGGLLLAAAFTVKHNTAAYGAVMAVGILYRFGWRQALAFGAAAALPALGFTVVMEATSGGHFTTTILDIASAHPMVGARFFPGAIEEMGKHLGALPLVLSALFVGHSMWAARTPLRMACIAAAAVGGAALVTAGGLQLPGARGMPQPEGWVEPMAWAAVGLAMGAVFGTLVSALGRRWWIAVAAGVSATAVALAAVATGQIPVLPSGGLVLLGTFSGLGVGALAAMLVPGAVSIRSGAWVYGVGVGAMALFTAGMMRAHHGGFLNVYIPMHFVAMLALAVLLGRARALPKPGGAGLSTVVMLGFFWTKSDFDPERYVPNDADVAAGDAFVEALAECEGPVLSPYNPWLPVLAGHTPSFHLIALWDIRHKKGPYFRQVADVRAAAQDQYWECVVTSTGRPLGFGVEENYAPWKRPTVPRSVRPKGVPPTFMPRTGWRVRPQNILKPR